MWYDMVWMWYYVLCLLDIFISGFRGYNKVEVENFVLLIKFHGWENMITNFFS